MRVSVCIVTYNQARYVDACIRSAATQFLDGEMEIVVGDDASQDDTPARLDALAKEFPSRVRVIHRPRNLGPGRNFAATLAECQGEYVAFLEGDNFWSDPDKLNQQARMLDVHPDMAFAFHRARSLHEPEIPGEEEHVVPERDFPTINGIDILFGANNPVAFGSMVVRRALLGDLETWTAGLKLGDWPLCMMLARHGKIGYIPEEMSRQRMHGGGVWTILSPHLRTLYVLEMLNRVCGLLDGAAQAAARARFDETRAWWARSIWDVSEDERAELRAALSRMGEPALTEAILWEVIAQGRGRLDWTEEQLEAHRAGWADEVAWLKGERDAHAQNAETRRKIADMKTNTLLSRLRKLRGKG